MGHTVLQVPVPELEPFVRARTAHYDTDYLSNDPAFTHAHVTVLGPFVETGGLTPEVLRIVGEIACGTAPFDFVAERVDTFPNGIIHLVPDPSEGFAALTARLVGAFPHHPPYAGEFAEVRPHLTLDAQSSTVSERSTRDLLGALLPARCHADRLDLACYEPGACRVLHSWWLGPNGLRPE